MSRIYAVEERSGKRFLVRIECDASGCDAIVKPHPEIASSGWTKRGGRDLSGMTWENDYCPRHS